MSWIIRILEVFANEIVEWSNHRTCYSPEYCHRSSIRPKIFVFTRHSGKEPRGKLPGPQTQKEKNNFTNNWVPCVWNSASTSYRVKKTFFAGIVWVLSQRFVNYRNDFGSIVMEFLNMTQQWKFQKHWVSNTGMKGGWKFLKVINEP